MIRIYTDKGMTEEDAHTIVTTMAKYRVILLLLFCLFLYSVFLFVICYFLL